MPVVEELKRPTKGKKIPLEEQSERDSIEKPKKQLTEAQKANLAKGRAARAAKLVAGQQVPEQVPEPKKQIQEKEPAKPKKQPKIVYQDASEEEESEPEVVIVKKRKPKKKKEPRVIYQDATESEGEEPKPIKPVRQSRTIIKNIEIQQPPQQFLRFV